MMTAMFATVGFAACAQRLDASKVPAAVKSSFAKQYPGVTAKWEKEAGNYEVNFKQNGITMSALYDANGSMKESEMDIKVTDLPATVQAYVKEHYKGKTVKEAAKITKADGTVNYEAEVGGVDVIFDVSGKFLNEAKD